MFIPIIDHTVAAASAGQGAKGLSQILVDAMPAATAAATLAGVRLVIPIYDPEEVIVLHDIVDEYSAEWHKLDITKNIQLQKYTKYINLKIYKKYNIYIKLQSRIT